jgi:esterase/lipase
MKNLLILHGAIGAKDQFYTLEDSLKSNYTIHLLNFGGHGGEAEPESFSIETFAKNVLDYLNKNNIKTINIFGYSMGGYVALYIAKHHPDRINKIFTLATKFLWTPEIAEKEIKMLDAAKIEEKIPAFAETLKKRHQPNDWKSVLQKTQAMMIDLGNNNRLHLSDYNSIAHTVQIGIGDKDTMVTLEETIAVYRNLKNSTFIVLPQTAHPIEKVDTKRLSNEIISFFG